MGQRLVRPRLLLPVAGAGPAWSGIGRSEGLARRLMVGLTHREAERSLAITLPAMEPTLQHSLHARPRRVPVRHGPAGFLAHIRERTTLTSRASALSAVQSCLVACPEGGSAEIRDRPGSRAVTNHLARSSRTAAFDRKLRPDRRPGGEGWDKFRGAEHGPHPSGAIRNRAREAPAAFVGAWGRGLTVEADLRSPLCGWRLRHSRCEFGEFGLFPGAARGTFSAP